MQDIQSILGQLDTAIFAKDLSHRYTYCNEKFAHATGEDSPGACYGKTDADVIWREYAGIYELSDNKVFAGQVLCNVFEPHRQLHRDKMTILVNKHPLLNRSGETVGIICSYVDVTDLNIVAPVCLASSLNQGYFDLGKYFDHATLSMREFEVFKKTLMGQTAKQIAHSLCVSPKTVETYVSRIKIKMQCTTRGEIISEAIRSGLYHQLLNILSK